MAKCAASVPRNRARIAVTYRLNPVPELPTATALSRARIWSDRALTYALDSRRPEPTELRATSPWLVQRRRCLFDIWTSDALETHRTYHTLVSEEATFRSRIRNDSP
jgi:hypothetical protein